jgi:signal transduction histidine kinase
MQPVASNQLEELFAEFIHDLRQPLNTIDNSVGYLDLLLREAEEPVHEQLRLIARQVDLAARILREASTWMCPPRTQCAAAGESRDLTKSQTAAVT